MRKPRKVTRFLEGTSGKFAGTLKRRDRTPVRHIVTKLADTGISDYGRFTPLQKKANPLGLGQLADFRVTHPLRINSDMLVVTASRTRTVLKISQLTDRGMAPAYDSIHWLSYAASRAGRLETI
jgi:hypothetical protein